MYVGDVNEHAPTVSPNYYFDVEENLPNRTLVGIIDATDADNPMETFNFTFTFANPSGKSLCFSFNICIRADMSYLFILIFISFLG